MISSFEPIIDNKSKILILGTMPGVRSLEKQEYYGHPQNAFWSILFGLFNVLPEEDYTTKKEYLLTHHIALWDVLLGCERQGSSDTAITHPVFNDLVGLLYQYPSIHSIFFNGAKAETLFRQYTKKHRIPGSLFTQTLPSTSPARTLRVAEKLEAWQVVFTRLKG